MNVMLSILPEPDLENFAMDKNYTILMRVWRFLGHMIRMPTLIPKV
jgi:hypothetical protein